MPEYVHLIGAEQVERAGHNISGAAETISRAAVSFDSSLHFLLPRLEELVARIEDVMKASDPSAPLAEAVEWESLDGVYRTTDKAVAENWAGAIGVRVVRRASKATGSAT